MRLRVMFFVGGVLFSSARPARAVDAKQCLQAAERGQALRAEGKLRAAREALRVAGAPSCPHVIRNDAMRWLDEIEQSMPTVVVKATADGTDVSDAKLSVDGEVVAETLDGKSFPVDPGPRVFLLERADQRVTVRAVVAEGEKNRRILMHLDAEPSGTRSPETATERSSLGASESRGVAIVPPPHEGDRGRSPPAFAYALGALGIVSFGTFAFFGIHGTRHLSDLRDGCAPACSDAEIASVKRDMTIADVSLGIAILSLGVGAVWWYLSTTPGTASRASH
jgi:hypothetical protein